MEILDAEEQDILQEIMNIGFGNAAADLAAVIDIYVQLSVPSVKIIPATEFASYIRQEVRDDRGVSIVEQSFWSRFKGIALLAFSDGAGKALMSVLVDEDSKRMFESDPLRVLEKEILMEVGNILVGACIGKVSDLLGDVISYSPPRVLIGNLTEKANTSRKMFGPGNIVIVLQTVFHFGKQDVRGYMFLVVSQESIGFLKQALKTFMEQYS